MVQIIELFGNKSLVKTLVFFLRNPSLQIHQQGLRKKIKIAKATSIWVMGFLVKNNLLKETSFGRTRIYSLNRENPLVKQIKLMDNLALLSEIKKILLDYDLRIYVYGSVARGEDVENSDVDILIVGKLKKSDIIQKINKISENMGKKIKIEVFSQLEWAQMAKKDPAFYERVEKDKIEL